MKNVKIRPFSDPYFSVYGQNRIRIFSHLNRQGSAYKQGVKNACFSENLVCILFL